MIRSIPHQKWCNEKCIPRFNKGQKSKGHIGHSWQSTYSFNCQLCLVIGSPNLPASKTPQMNSLVDPTLAVSFPNTGTKTIWWKIIVWKEKKTLYSHLQDENAGKDDARVRNPKTMVLSFLRNAWLEPIAFVLNFGEPNFKRGLNLRVEGRKNRESAAAKKLGTGENHER